MPDFPASRWESRLFRAFAVREDGRCDGRVRSCAPRVVLRFEGLKNRFRTFSPEPESAAPKTGSKNSTRGAVAIPSTAREAMIFTTMAAGMITMANIMVEAPTKFASHQELRRVM